MVATLALQFRTLSIIRVGALIFSLLLLIHLGSSYGFQRIHMLSHLEETAGTLDKVLGPISLTEALIAIGTPETAETEILGGTVTEKGASPKLVRTEILGGTSLLGGSKTRPNGIGTIVLGGTLQNRHLKGAIENVIGHRRRGIIKPPA